MRAVEVGFVEGAGAVGRPQPPAIGAGAEPPALVAARQHRADREHDRRHVGAHRAHQLGRNGLVAAADQHHRIERQRGDHLLGVHGHEIAQQHRGRERERLVQRDGRERERQPAGEPHAARDRFGDLRRVAVAGVEVGGGREDADDRAIERLIGVAGGLEEAAPQEQRELLVPVLGEPGPQAFFIGLQRTEDRRRKETDRPSSVVCRPSTVVCQEK